MQYQLIAQGIPGEDTIYTALSRATHHPDIDRFDIAVAYATQPGLQLITALSKGRTPLSRWVIGLDDCITQPQVLTNLKAALHTDLRIVQLTPDRRFHPKLYCFWSSKNPVLCHSILGSGNMTNNGLQRNGETAVFLSAETPIEAKALRSQWNYMWTMGLSLTDEILSQYKIQYTKARKHRKQGQKEGFTVSEVDIEKPPSTIPKFDGTAATASVAWLEAGSPSAGGRDLEFPKAIVPFFHLTQSPHDMCFEMRPGIFHTLRFTERTDNQMWRLMFSRDAIEDCIGRPNLRPATGGNRSDFVILFHRTTGTAQFQVQIMAQNDKRVDDLRKRSTKVGTLQKTRNPGGREFGFF